jgi:two-component system phosphate regulon sensor histidine kinase PhoR
MKFKSPDQIALVVSTAGSMMAGIAVFYFLNHVKYNAFLTITIVAVLVFTVVFIISRITIKRFIISKINPIYKTIYNLNIKDEEILNDIGNRDMVSTIQNDVLIWASKKTKEIDRLRELEKYRKEFLGNVSHELKTPIFNIQGYISTLIEGGLEDAEINIEYLKKADRSLNRLISIVNDLESITKLESGELKLNFQKTNIVSIVTESFDMHEALAKEKNITLKFAKKFDKPLMVIADPKLMLEAINNLIANSIKYGKENGTSTVNFIDIGEHLLVEIQDNGIGIAEHDLPRIFERFFRADKSRSRDMGGTGLGLAIVKHILEAHNQVINVSSKIDEGSMFSFTLKKA